MLQTATFTRELYFGVRGTENEQKDYPKFQGREILASVMTTMEYISYITGTRSGLTTPLRHIYLHLMACTSSLVYSDLTSVYFPQQTKKKTTSRERKLFKIYKHGPSTAFKLSCTETKL